MKLTSEIRPLYFVGIVLTTILIVGSFGALAVKAMPSFFVKSDTAYASTTVTYLSPGNATSTVYFDTGRGTTEAMDTAVLFTQFTASSTNSILNISLEYADVTAGVNCQDTPTACDWYGNTLLYERGLGTTTIPASLNTSYFYQWKYASTTQGGGGVVAANNRDLRVINIPTPTRYVRAIYTLNIGGTNGAVSGYFVGQREN